MLCAPFQSSSIAATILSPLFREESPRRTEENVDGAFVPPHLQVPDGHEMHLHAFAEGAQIYVWNGNAWIFHAPEALLFDADGKLAAVHFTGPTWESLSGSEVIASRVRFAPSAHPNSIPQLLLRARATAGAGIFSATTYIQRLNTTGGLAPLRRGSIVGEKTRAAYTAEYLFYREAA
jgi:hypothetical protein